MHHDDAKKILKEMDYFKEKFINDFLSIIKIPGGYIFITYTKNPFSSSSVFVPEYNSCF